MCCKHNNDKNNKSAWNERDGSYKKRGRKVPRLTITGTLVAAHLLIERNHRLGDVLHGTRHGLMRPHSLELEPYPLEMAPELDELRDIIACSHEVFRQYLQKTRYKESKNRSAHTIAQVVLRLGQVSARAGVCAGRSQLLEQRRL